MKTTQSPSNLIPTIVFWIIILALLATKWIYGQTPAPDPHAGHHPPPAAVTTPDSNAVTPAPAPVPDAMAEKGMGMMGMMKNKMMKGGAASPAMGGGAPKAEGCSCEMMGMKNEQQAAAADDAVGGLMPGLAGRAAAATPGVAGTSHLFPIGARGFFLNHGDLITLLPAQVRALRQLHEKVFLEQAEFGRKLASSEQAWWVLAAADSPGVSKVNAQLAIAESIRTARRAAYVKAVIEAIGLLTEDQRQILLGTKIPAGKQP